jgi:RluA family pseudouridine synthase
MPSTERDVKRVAQTIIRHPWTGRTLHDLLGERFTYLTPDTWARLIASGDVRVNGERAMPAQLLAEGDRVDFTVPEIEEPAVATDYRVLYADEALLAVDKPADLPCHPGGKFFRHTLWALLRRDLGVDKLYFVNRLDRETSGIVLIARTALAARVCGRPARRRAMVKEYLAIVEGHLAQPVHAQGWMLDDTASTLRKKQRFVAGQAGVEPPPGASRAETWFEPVRRAGALSLLRVRLGTGRTHQIRATLLALGLPLVGDKVYGRDETLYVRFIERSLSDEDRRTLRLDRQALHSCRLQLQHPYTDALLDIESPLPPDLAALVPP